MRELRLPAWRSIHAAARPIAPTVPWSIDQDDAKACGQTIAERQSHIFEIRTRTVQQDDGRGVCRAKLEHMQPASLNRDESPGWRMRCFDRVDARRGDQGESSESSCRAEANRDGQANRHNRH
jgi:hypothetical protein